MSGASTEPCRGRGIPGLARCRQGQRTLSVGLTAFGRSSRAPRRLRALYRSDYARSTVRAGAAVGSAAASSRLQLPRRRVCGAAVAVSEVVRGLLFLFFDKVADMPVIAQLQNVDKLVISLLRRSCVFRGARRGEDSPIHTVGSTRTMVDVPVVQVRAWLRCSRG